FGRTWQLVYIQAQGQVLNAVSFADSLNGMAAGVLGIVFRTIDGGMTWTMSQSLTRQEFLAIHMFNDSEAIATGTGGAIFRTANGGQSWVNVSLPTVAMSISAYPNPANNSLTFEYTL